MTKAEVIGEGLDVVPSLEVVGRVWVDGDYQPPSLELRLNDGSYVRVGYDTNHHCRNLWTSPDATTDFISATVDQTGLSADVLASFEAEVELSTRQWEAEQDEEASERASDTWSRHGGGGR